MSTPVTNEERDGRVKPGRFEDMDVVGRYLAAHNGNPADQDNLSAAQNSRPSDQTSGHSADQSYHSSAASTGLDNGVPQPSQTDVYNLKLGLDQIVKELSCLKVKKTLTSEQVKRRQVLLATQRQVIDSLKQLSMVLG